MSEEYNRINFVNGTTLVKVDIARVNKQVRG